MIRESYKLKTDLTKQQLIDAGFRSWADTYTLKRYLYKNMISLNIVISKYDMEIDQITVTDDINCGTYSPFYYNEFGGKNLVLDEVNKKYKTAMEDLTKKGIMKKCRTK